jgi:hypothetical protein
MQHHSHNPEQEPQAQPLVTASTNPLAEASMTRGSIIANATTMVNPSRIEEAFAPSIKGFDLNVVGSIGQLINDSGIQHTFEVNADKAQFGPGSLEVASANTTSGMITKLLTLELSNSEEKARALKEAGLIENAKTYGAVPAFKLASEQRYVLTEGGKELIREALVATNAYMLGNLTAYVKADQVEAIQQKIANNEITIKQPTSLMDSAINQLGKTASQLSYIDSLIDRDSALDYVRTLFNEDLAFIVGFSRDIKNGAVLRSAEDISPATEQEIKDAKDSGELRRVISAMRAAESGQTESPSLLSQSEITLEQFDQAADSMSLGEIKDLGKQLVQLIAGRHSVLNKFIEGLS